MTYSQSERATPRRIRILRRRVSGVLAVGVAAIAGGVGYRSLASSPSAAGPPGGGIPGEHRAARGDALPRAVWPADGQAAVQIGQSQVHAGPYQHPAAIASVAKVMT